MNDEELCPTCGGALARGGALAGLCPRCLLAGGSGSAGAAGGGSAGAGEGPADALHDLAEVRARFPELDVEEEIGRGGMGVVYRARQRRLDRTVALKLLAPELARDPAFAGRFQREARALARLSHPHVVGVHDFGERDGLFYLLLEYVDGVGVRDVLRRRALDPVQALALVPQICSGLQYAHERGVVHRDVKPENLLLDRDGNVKIADFGLAKIVDPTEDGALTRASQVMGTPQYMAPEQIATPLAVDHRADIYSLGVVLYEMLTGELPLGPFESPARRLGLDARLDDVVRKTLEREPERRYQRADELGTDVEGLSGAGRTPRRPARRGGGLAGAVGWFDEVPGGAPTVAVVVLVLAWSWGWFVRSRGLHVHFHAVAYPLAYVALFAGRAWRPRAELEPWRRVLVAVGGLASIVALWLACSSVESDVQLVFAGISTSLAFAAGLALERWVLRGEEAGLLGAASVMLLATIVHASTDSSPGREAYYFSSGIGALLCAGPIVLLLPEVLVGRAARPTLMALARAAALGVVGAALFFNRAIF